MLSSYALLLKLKAYHKDCIRITCYTGLKGNVSEEMALFTRAIFDSIATVEFKFVHTTPHSCIQTRWKLE